MANKDSAPEPPFFVRLNVRASMGSAGTHVGLKIDTNKIYKIYKPTKIKPGVNAALYKSPTGRPNWLASTMSTKEGGMICASVPEAAMVPEATRLS